jgi:2-iminobutanoate/2-iminopropanoate deaminase
MATQREVISSKAAPEAIGPYSQAIRAPLPGGGAIVFLSGQIPLDPATGELIGTGDVRAQAERVMENIARVLEASGLAFANVMKTTIFLADLGDFATVNEVYGKRFEGVAPPARSTVQVAGLPRGAKVEIEVIAIA